MITVVFIRSLYLYSLVFTNYECLMIMSPRLCEMREWILSRLSIDISDKSRHITLKAVYNTTSCICR